MCVGFSDSLVVPQQVKTRSRGYLDHGGEGIGGKEFDAPLRPLGRMRTPPAGLVCIRREVGTTERQRNYMDPKWTKHPFLAGGSAALPPVRIQQQSLSPPCSGSIWTSESQSQSLFPQFLLHHFRDNPTPLRVFSCCGSTRDSENPTAQSLRFIISENSLVSLAAAQWVNKDCKHVWRIKHLFWQMCLKLLLYNVVDDQHLEKLVLLIQPWVKSKSSVYWMHVDDDTVIGGSYIGTTPASSSSVPPF